MGHVHERCLQEWVQSHAESAEVPGIPTCPTCKQAYRGDVLLLLAASSALRMQLDLPPAAESCLVTALQGRRMLREANALLRRRMRWNVLVADEGDPATLQGILNVASAMGEIRQHRAAATLLRRVLKHCAQILGYGAGGRGGSASGALWQCLWPGCLQLDACDEEAELLEHEHRCVLLIAQGATAALAEALQRQGLHSEAEEQLRRGRALGRKALAWRCLSLAWALRPFLASVLLVVALGGGVAVGGVAFVLSDTKEHREVKSVMALTVAVLAVVFLASQALCVGLLLWAAPRLLRAAPPPLDPQAAMAVISSLGTLAGLFAYLCAWLAFGTSRNAASET